MSLARLYPLLLILLLFSVFLGLLVFAGTALGLLIGVFVIVGPVLILWTMGMAMAGAGNRLAWSGIFVVLSMSCALLLRQISAGLPDRMGVAGGVLGCAAVALVPAFILWSATALRRRRASATSAVAMPRQVRRGGPSPAA